MDSVPLRPLKKSMSRDSDESRRLVGDDRRPNGRVSGSIDDAEGFEEEIDDFVKGRQSSNRTSS